VRIDDSQSPLARIKRIVYLDPSPQLSHEVGNNITQPLYVSPFYPSRSICLFMRVHMSSYLLKRTDLSSNRTIGQSLSCSGLMTAFGVLCSSLCSASSCRSSGYLAAGISPSRDFAAFSEPPSWSSYAGCNLSNINTILYRYTESQTRTVRMLGQLSISMFWVTLVVFLIASFSVWDSTGKVPWASFTFPWEKGFKWPWDKS